MAIEITEMMPEHCEAVVEMVSAAAPVAEAPDGGLTLESPDQIKALIRRKPRLSLVARNDGDMVGVILCNGDGGDHGYHLIVLPAFRDGDVPRELIGRAVMKMVAQGIHRSHIHVNQAADPDAFWDSIVWRDRPCFGAAGADVASSGAACQAA